MPPSTGAASGFMNSAPVRVDHIGGSKPATTVATVMTLGRSRSSAPSMTAACSPARQHAICGNAAGNRLFQVDDHHHAGLDGGAEQRDEAHPHRNREVVSEQLDEEDAAGQSEGNRQQNMGSFLP